MTDGHYELAVDTRTDRERCEIWTPGGTKLDDERALALLDIARDLLERRIAAAGA